MENEECQHTQTKWMEIFDDIDVPTGKEGLVCTSCGAILEERVLNN